MASAEIADIAVIALFMLWVSLCLAFMIGGIMYHAWTKEQNEQEDQ
jgi:hypothetical protein